MNSRTYLVISGTVFGIVAVLHFLRVVNGWIMVLGPWSVPIWVSWLGTLVRLFCVSGLFGWHRGSRHE